MYAYELMIIFRPDFDIEDKKKTEDALKKFVGENAVISGTTVIGKKRLEYPIEKHNEGIYVLTNLESKIGLSTAKIQRQVQLGESVIRFLLTAKINTRAVL